MANVLNGNTLYVDTAGDLKTTPTKVYFITVTATAANSILALADTSSSVPKIELRVATSGATQLFDFSANPLFFPNGVEATTVTTARATLVL
jgi:hypothetical protein